MTEVKECVTPISREVIWDIHAKLNQLTYSASGKRNKQLRLQIDELEKQLMCQQMEQKKVMDENHKMASHLETTQSELAYYKGLNKELK